MRVPDNKLRITGGALRSRLISRVGLETTREQQDIVRLASFNVLGNNLSGKAIDMFAGSGAIIFEAISRGVSEAYANDLNDKAYHTIIENTRILSLENKVHVYNEDYLVFLNKIQNTVFDYVFIDPPYALLDYNGHALLFERLVPLITGSSKIVMETRKENDYEFKNYKKIFSRVYGIKRIVIYMLLNS